MLPSDEPRFAPGSEVTLFLSLAAIAVAVVTGAWVWLHQRRAARPVVGPLEPLERELGTLRAEVARLSAEQAVLSGFLAGLPVFAQELRYVKNERQIPATLVDALVRTLEPQQVVVLMRRRRGVSDGSGARFVVAAAHPPDGGIWAGLEVTMDTEPSTSGTEVLRATGLPFGPRAVAVPMVLETQLTGLIAVVPSVPRPGVRLVVEAVAGVGALALHEAAGRQRLRAAAHIDELTRLFNRRYVARILSEEIIKARETNRPLSVLLFDVDSFKLYNDQNGHLEGDILLRLLAQLVRENVRGTDVVGRFGGEEFLLVLPATSTTEALGVAEKLRLLVAAHPFPGRAKQPKGVLSISGGVATCPLHGATVSALLRAADAALYSAKRAGRNRMIEAEPSLDHEEAARVAFEETWEDGR